VLATQVSIIQLHAAREAMLALTQSHGVADLVLQGPGRGVADAQVSLQGQRRKSGLGLADQIDGQEPNAQWQLGVLEQAAGGQRGLVPASLALEEPAGAVPDHPVIG